MYCNTTIVLQAGMAGLVSQYNGLYRGQGGEPSCRIVSQYSSLYCDTGAREMGRAILQYSHCTCDTAQAWRERRQARGARQRRETRALGGQPGRAVGCGLCTWCTQPVFDSV